MSHLIIDRCSEMDVYFRNMLISGGVNLSDNDTLVLRSEERLPDNDLNDLTHPEGTYKYNILVLKDGETYDQYLDRIQRNEELRKSYSKFQNKAARRLKSGGWI